MSMNIIEFLKKSYSHCGLKGQCLKLNTAYMNDIHKIKKAYTDAIKALEGGYSHKVRDAIENLNATFEQEYPERTKEPEVAFLQLQVAAVSIRYHIFRQDVLSAIRSFSLLCEESNQLLEADILDDFYSKKTCQLVDETEQVLNSFRENMEHVDYSLTGQPSPYVKPYSPEDQFRNYQVNDTCLLCKDSQDLCTGSHLAPHFIVGSIFSFDGSRDRDKEIVNEETIASLKKERKWGSRVNPDAIDKIFGEEIPEDEKIERKRNALTRDYFFCKRCEDRFGHIESAYSVLFTNRNKQLNPAIPYLFWLFVFWRLSVSNMCVRLSIEDEENIREILNAQMPDARKEVDSLIANENYGTYRYCLYHCSNIKGELTGLIGNHVSHSPYKLILGNYIVVLYSTKTKRDKKKIYNDWHTNEVCQEIPFLEFWKQKRNILDTVEDLEYSNITSDEASIVDIVQADSGFEVKQLLPHKTLPVSIDNISDDKDHLYSHVIPGSVARMLAWTKAHKHLSIAEQCYGIEREFGYTAGEMEYMYNWYFARLGKLKAVKKRKK